MLRIEIARKPDGVGVLRCTRQDGSIAWQTQPKHGAFFALHDLTHYAVESALGYRSGFFGLIAEGWNMDDLTGKGSHGSLPAEALEVEQIVGLFDSERGSRTLWTSEEFNRSSPRVLTDAEIQMVRSLRAELFSRWSAIAPGQTLHLTFTVRAG